MGGLQLACLDVGLDGCRTERGEGQSSVPVRSGTDAAQECLNLAASGRHLSPIPIYPESLMSKSNRISPPPLKLTVINPHADDLSGQSLSAGKDMQSTGFLN